MIRLNVARLTLLSLLVAAPLSSALGGQLSAVINGKSIHVGGNRGWNENNVGLGLEYEFASKSRWKMLLMANGFRDSNKQMSYMAGGGLHRTLYSTERLNGFYVNAGINAFFMTRKDVNDNQPFPGAVPSVTIGNRYVGLNLTYLPKQAVEKTVDAEMLDESLSSIVFLQVKVSFGGLSSAD